MTLAKSRLFVNHQERGLFRPITFYMYSSVITVCHRVRLFSPYSIRQCLFLILHIFTLTFVLGLRQRTMRHLGMLLYWYCICN